MSKTQYHYSFDTWFA